MLVFFIEPMYTTHPIQQQLVTAALFQPPALHFFKNGFSFVAFSVGFFWDHHIFNEKLPVLGPQLLSSGLSNTNFLRHFTHTQNSTWQLSQLFSVLNVLPVHFCPANWHFAAIPILIPRAATSISFSQTKCFLRHRILPWKKCKLPSVTTLEDLHLYKKLRRPFRA